MDFLRKFHNMNLKVNHEFDLFKNIDFYESLWNLIGMFILLRVLKISTQKGTGLAVYLIWYGFGRALIEGIRGDSLIIGSSPIRVSQALSVVLILVGVALLVFNIVKKRKGNGQEI